jgi:hypothetical protein
MTNYTWTVGPFECILNQDGLEKIVTLIHWRLKGIDEDGVWSETYGTQPVGQPDPEAFTPFTEISQEQAVGWLESLIDVDSMKAKIDEEITALKTPVVATLAAPWSV